MAFVVNAVVATKNGSGFLNTKHVTIFESRSQNMAIAEISAFSLVFPDVIFAIAEKKKNVLSILSFVYGRKQYRQCPSYSPDVKIYNVEIFDYETAMWETADWGYNTHFGLREFKPGMGQRFMYRITTDHRTVANHEGREIASEHADHIADVCKAKVAGKPVSVIPNQENLPHMGETEIYPCHFWQPTLELPAEHLTNMANVFAAVSEIAVPEYQERIRQAAALIQQAADLLKE